MEVDDLLHYGLLVGAIFQLIAIGAIIFLPSVEENDDTPDGKGSSETGEGQKEEERRTAGAPTTGQTSSTAQPSSAVRKRKGKNKR